jgi:hypothetical protein
MSSDTDVRATITNLPPGVTLARLPNGNPRCAQAELRRAPEARRPAARQLEAQQPVVAGCADRLFLVTDASVRPGRWSAVVSGRLAGGTPLASSRVVLTVPTPPACPAGPFGPDRWPPACWRPYADNSPFNTPVPAGAAVRGDSRAIVDRIVGDIATVPYVNNLVVHDDGTSGEPTYYARTTGPDPDPAFTLTCVGDGAEVPAGPCAPGLASPAKVRIPAGAVREDGERDRVCPTPATCYDTDRHMTVVDQAAGWEYDFWQVRAHPIPDPGRGNDGALAIARGGRTRLDGLGHNEPGGDATAAHWGNLAGRLRAEEFAAGHIRHALFIVVDCVAEGDGVYPADPAGRARPCTRIGKRNENAPPLGAWLHLDMRPMEIVALGLPRWQTTLLRAMAEYGMFIGDTGATGIFQIEHEAGSQYQSVTRVRPAQDADAWLRFARSNGWEPTRRSPAYDHAGYTGCMGGGCSPQARDAAWWKANVWSRLRVLEAPSRR